MLKVGSSNYPYTLHTKAGLDMASPAPYEAPAARMTRIMDEIEAIKAKKQGLVSRRAAGIDGRRRGAKMAVSKRIFAVCDKLIWNDLSSEVEV